MSGWLFLDGRGVLFEVASRDIRACSGLPPWAAPTEAAVRVALASAAQAAPGLEDARSTAQERGLWRAYWRAFLTALGLPEAHAVVLQREAHWDRHCRLYPEVMPTLEAIRAAGFQLGLISNGPPSMAEGMAHLKLAPLFSCIMTSSECGYRKPDPQIFRLALAQAGAHPRDAWFVDDQLAHVQAAARLGMRALLLDRAGRGGDLTSLTELLPLMTN